MLKPKALVDLLGQANTGGVISTMLLNPEGSLLAYAGSEDKDAKVTAAVASNIWSAYEKNGKIAFHGEGLEFMFLVCEMCRDIYPLQSVKFLLSRKVMSSQNISEGTVTVTKVSNVLLCMYSKPDVGLGLLKTKAEAIVEYLEEPLRQIAT